MVVAEGIGGDTFESKSLDKTMGAGVVKTDREGNAVIEGVIFSLPLGDLLVPYIKHQEKKSPRVVAFPNAAA